MAKGWQVSPNLMMQVNAPEKNPPLFPSAAAAVAATGPMQVMADVSKPVQESLLTESRTPRPPGLGCVWCWQVAAAGDAGKEMPRLADLIPRPLAAALGMKISRDFLDIEGGKSFLAVSADWSAVGAKGVLCHRAPLFFDAWNASGSNEWDPKARGCIVVARRGADSFEAITRSAENVGAVAVVILDDQEEWEDDYDMALETAMAPPKIPAVLVSKQAEIVLTGQEKLHASIVRR